MNRLIDDVFADFVAADEELLDLHRLFVGVLPGAEIVLIGDNGAMVGGPLAGLTEELLVELQADRHDDGGFRSRVLADGRWLHCLRLPEEDALLCFSHDHWQADLADNDLEAVFCRNSIDLALLRRRHREAVVENEQLNRRMEVVSSKHMKLLDENHQQFLQIREKEQEYAKKLESEIARQTKELRETNARLEQVSRLKSEFLANMSHELRTPMNAIIGFSGLLAETRLTDEQREFTEIIRKSCSSLLVLINDILDLAKIEAGRLELDVAPFSLVGLLKSVDAMFRSQAALKKNRLAVRCDAGSSDSLVGDEHRLRQVLINLVGNAMKFTAGGEIAVIAEKVREDTEAVTLRFSVQDTGIGIPLDRQQAVFEKFTQADGSTTRKYGGTGLGLAITSQLVAIMGSRVELDSQPGQGSTFSFVISLPKAAHLAETERSSRLQENGKATVAKAVDSSRPAVAGEAVAPADLHVLIVEDNVVNQRLASLLLQKAGCSADIAGDGGNALEMLKNNYYDFVLMDVQMPNMDGHTATRRIRELEASAERGSYVSLAGRPNRLYIVGLTAHARKEDEQQCLAAGMDAFLAKPIVREKLLAVIAAQRKHKK